MIGRRPRNEDYLGLCLPSRAAQISHGVVAALADGVGGGKGGRVAAELTVRAFIDAYYAQSPTIGVPLAAARAIDGINLWLRSQGRTDPALEECATTFVTIILRGRTAHALHVGDSRAYLLSNGVLSRLTEDHTLNQGGLSHVLYRGVGIEETVRLDHTAVAVQAHDRFLLCSDGVHGALNDRRLRGLLLDRSTPEAVARAVVDEAFSAGSADNISALVVDVLNVPIADYAELETALSELPIGAVPKTGDEIDGFKLEEVISDGRYSRLFKARDSAASERTLALKFPIPEAAENALFHRAFLREMWVTRRVRSPWLGETLEAPPGRQTRLYAIMPHYEGETLERRLLRAPRVSVEEGVSLGIKLGRATAVLHRAGVIHRDIKPENVILAKEGPRLIDLGVARLPRLESAPVVGDNPGTPSYMAPELLEGKPADELSDLYALGVTLYRVFTGGYPYGEIEPFSHPRFGKPTPLDGRRRDLPAWLNAVVMRATEVDPRKRFSDVLEFVLELEQGLSGHAVAPMRRRPLYQRNPLLFWQILSLLLTLGLLASLGSLLQ